MIPFTITGRDMERAESHLLTYGELFSNQDKWIGALGEIAVYNWINQWSPCYLSGQGCSYDILLGDARTVEVKTVRTTVTPQPHYMVNLAVEQWEKKLDVDVWIFVRVHESLTHGWIVAYCEADKRDRFHLHFAGELMGNRRQYRKDTMDCPISELDDPTRLVIHA